MGDRGADLRAADLRTADLRTADFRTVDVAALTWFPPVRKLVPVTQIRVQTPPARCAVGIAPGYYRIDLELAGPAWAAFLDFCASVEAHALEHAARHADGRSWRSWANADGLVPRARLSAFSDALFFESDGAPAGDPTGFAACACLLELGGAWTSDAAWGLRWKVLQVKREPQPPDAWEIGRAHV